MPGCSDHPVPPPVRPTSDWEHRKLYERVLDAIASLPIHFDSETYIEGMSATDIFSLNAALGATIEEQVVEALNRVRSSWDPDDQYGLYGFVRQAQTFPDVILRRLTPDPSTQDDIVLGIELKGWYVLSKEAEPSFRFAVTPEACADADLLVCVPWALKNVLSGRPKVYAPYIESAKRAAQLRNHYWQWQRATKGSREVKRPITGIRPYPSKTDQISDRPAYDAGGNFGRYARTGFMDAFVQRTLQEPLCGIAAGAWLSFFKLFTESAADEGMHERIAVLRKKLVASRVDHPGEPEATYLAILDILEQALSA